LKDTAFILLLNKVFEMKEKMKTRPLVDIFEDYEEFIGKLSNTTTLSDSEKALEFFKSNFVKVFGGNRLSPFCVDLIDYEQFKRILWIMGDIITTERLKIPL
jgi:hypothetical protein